MRRAIICGAGMAGVSAAYWLAAGGKVDVTLVDERDPLTLTSDKSSEAYRDWWPDPAMAALISRSITLMEALADQTGNAIGMNRRGYLYATRDREHLPGFIAGAHETAAAAGSELRVDAGAGYVPSPAEGYRDAPGGADLLTDRGMIQTLFPYLHPETCAVLHARRAGWLSAQQLGALLLERARQNGVRLVRGRVDAVETAGGRVRGARLAGGERLAGEFFINASGPYLGEVGRLVGVDLPVRNEVHLKAALKDTRGVVPRGAPLTILVDRQRLEWSEEESEVFAGDPELGYLAGELPGGAHLRPEGAGDSPIVLLLWDYHPVTGVEASLSPEGDPLYQEIALRGLTRLVPGLAAYVAHPHRPNVDGGYYTRTPENRPLIGPCGPDGSFLLGALSGFGIMAAMAAGELLRRHVLEEELPEYAGALLLRRYEQAGYLPAMLAQEDGQL